MFINSPLQAKNRITSRSSNTSCARQFASRFFVGKTKSLGHLISMKINNGIRMSKNSEKRKFPSDVVIPLFFVVAWFLYSGKTIGRNGGASRIDDPYMYWSIIALIVGVILYKIVEYFDL